MGAQRYVEKLTELGEWLISAPASTYKPPGQSCPGSSRSEQCHVPALTRSSVVLSATLGPMNRQALPCPARARSNQEYRNRQPEPTENPSATPFGP